MIYNETGTGGCIIDGYGVVFIDYALIIRYKENDTAYLLYKAQVGLLRYIVVKRVIATVINNTEYVKYISTHNEIYFDQDLITKSNAINVANAYNQQRLLELQQQISGISPIYNNVQMKQTQTSSINISISSAQTPFPVLPIPTEGQHPRLIINQSDIPRLQSWATSSNPIWKSLQTVINTSVSKYQSFFPGGTGSPTDVPASPFPDDGDTTGYITFSGTNIPTKVEVHAVVLALASLMSTNSSQQAQYAGYARNLIMYALNQVSLGFSAGAPFRDPQFPFFDRGKGSFLYPVVVDWIYPYLSSSDKATILKAFLLWANACLTATATGGDHPVPVGTINSLTLLPHYQPYRMAANNYYISHTHLLTDLGLCMDLADDVGGQLRCYLSDALGAWHYQIYAMYGDATQVGTDYGINSKGLGLSSGGIPPEGLLYGESVGWLIMSLISLVTSGCTDPSVYGPQVKLTTSGFLNRVMPALFSWLDPVPHTIPGEAYLGAIYGAPGFGDMLRKYIEPDIHSTIGPLAYLQQKTNSNPDLNGMYWGIQNIPPGGVSNFQSRISNPWTWGVDTAIWPFLAFNPSLPTPTDPRGSLPSTFIDNGLGTLISKNGGSKFYFRAPWISINHQQSDAGSLGLYRTPSSPSGTPGEWLTSELGNYDSNGIGQTVVVGNTIAAKNTRQAGEPSSGTLMKPPYDLGGQFWLAQSAGDPSVSFSSGSDYVHANSILTNLYNWPEIYDSTLAAISVSYVSRLAVWLNGFDTIVVYDLITSLQGLFKRNNFCTYSQPVINGNLATAQTPSGQNLTITSLLPIGAGLSAINRRSQLSSVADGETMTWSVQIDDTAMPADSRLLTVLQGTDSGVTAPSVSLIQATSGTLLDGAVIPTGSTNVAVLFVKNPSISFSGTTFNLPSGITTLYIAGLTPNTQYSVTNISGTINLNSGTGFQTDSAGLLKVPL